MVNCLSSDRADCESSLALLAELLFLPSISCAQEDESCSWGETGAPSGEAGPAALGLPPELQELR